VSTHSDKSWKLDELAAAAGVSARTVRYYVQRGLLPAPLFRGRDTVYSQAHLTRLQAIRRLQDRFLPLDQIQAEIERRSADELLQLAEGRDPAPLVTPPMVPKVPPVAPRVQEVARWTRAVLLPGLELHLADGADASARLLAEELLAKYGR
jgi:DNA-binding transcriptional MerR regulator